MSELGDLIDMSDESEIELADSLRDVKTMIFIFFFFASSTAASMFGDVPLIV